MPTEILQLTDLHLMSDPLQKLKGVPTRDALLDLLEFIRGETRSGRWNFAYVVVTGDLVHDEQFETYQMLKEILGDWVPRCRLIPGNHDNREAIRRVFPELVLQGSSYACFSVEAGGWRLIGLDSHLPGEVAGQLQADQFAWLADELAQHATQPTLLFCHHPPFPVRSAWLDRIGLRDPAPLLELIQANPQVRVICTGHVHHEFQDHLNGVDLLTTPSTGVQFRPHEDTPVCDAIAAGFRTFQLDGDSYRTEIVRLPSLRFPPQTPGDTDTIRIGS